MAIIAQKNLFSWKEIEASSDLERLSLVLEVIGDERLMQILEKKRKGKRDDYPIRAVWNSILAGIVYQHDSIESLRRELLRNGELRELCGFEPAKGDEAVPPKWVYTRFLKRLIKEQVEIDRLFNNLIEELKKLLPDLGEHLAIDSKAIKSHAVGKKEAKGSSDKEADWGVKTYRGKKEDGSLWEKVKSWFGYKVHLIVDTKYELPLGYEITKASASDTTNLLPMVEGLNSKHPEIIETAKDMSGDKGYDSEDNNRELYDRYGIKPVIDIRKSWKDEKESKIKTRPLYEDRADNVVYDNKGVVYCHIGKGDDLEKDYATMSYMGFESDRKTLKYRCPAAAYGITCCNRDRCGEGNYGEYGRVVRIPIEKDRRMWTPIARSSYAFERIYKGRTAVERVNSRIDNVFGFEFHYIRGKAKMQLRMSLALIVMLAMAVGRIKKNREEDMRSLVMPIAA
jgi:hypothetical protein